MENITEKENRDQELFNKWEEQKNRGRIFGGLIVLGIGIVLLIKKLGVEIPEWIISWPTLLMALGLFIGYKHKFSKPVWLIPFAFGCLGLFSHFIPEFNFGYLWFPLMLILIGLYLLFKPKTKCREQDYFYRMSKKKYEKMNWQQTDTSSQSSTGSWASEDHIDSVSVFGGVKKNIISKNFKGGSLTSFFGGAEINLNQADFEGTVELEITQVFGGTRLIVPSHWEIQSEIAAVFGSVEDKRMIKQEVAGQNKVLVLRGTSVFGGIEIKSF